VRADELDGGLALRAEREDVRASRTPQALEPDLELEHLPTALGRRHGGGEHRVLLLRTGPGVTGVDGGERGVAGQRGADGQVALAVDLAALEQLLRLVAAVRVGPDLDDPVLVRLAEVRGERHLLAVRVELAVVVVLPRRCAPERARTTW
jgi:hypothetical protein